MSDVSDRHLATVRRVETARRISGPAQTAREHVGLARDQVRQASKAAPSGSALEGRLWALEDILKHLETQLSDVDGMVATFITREEVES